MEMMIDEAIQHIKDSCYIVGYPTHDKQQETREKVNASLDMAIDTMRKYQKVKRIIKAVDDRDIGYSTMMDALHKVVDDENND